MPHIHPISELKSHFSQITQLCRDTKEPVYLTRKGHGDLVLMSMAGYEELLAKATSGERQEAALELLWVREAEQRYADIESEQITCRPLEDAVHDLRKSLI